MVLIISHPSAEKDTEERRWSNRNLFDWYLLFTSARRFPLRFFEILMLKKNASRIMCFMLHSEKQSYAGINLNRAEEKNDWERVSECERRRRRAIYKLLYYPSVSASPVALKPSAPLLIKARITQKNNTRHILCVCVSVLLQCVTPWFGVWPL